MLKEIKNISLVVVTGYAFLFGGWLPFLPNIIYFFMLMLVLIFFYQDEFKITLDVLVTLTFSLFGIASMLWAENKWTAMYSAFLLSGSMYYLVLRSSDGWKERVIYSILLCSVINGMVGIYQAYSHETILGFFNNKNKYSGFLTPVIPIAIYFYYKTNKIIIGSIVSFLVFSNILSNSRAGITSMSLSLLAIFLYFWIQREKQTLRNVAIVVACGIISCLLFSNILELFYASSPNTFDSTAITSIYRFSIFQDALRFFSLSPIIGHGINSFSGLMRTKINPFLDYYDTGITHAHNIFLNILSELGIVGILLYVLFLILVLKGRPVSRSFFFKVSFISFLIHNLYEYNFLQVQ